MAKQIILGVQVTNRQDSVPEVQRILSEYGCNIKTRLGLHEVVGNSCSGSGLLLLETIGDEAEILKMEAKLKKVKGVKVKKMAFEG